MKIWWHKFSYVSNSKASALNKTATDDTYTVSVRVCTYMYDLRPQWIALRAIRRIQCSIKQCTVCWIKWYWVYVHIYKSDVVEYTFCIDYPLFNLTFDTFKITSWMIAIRVRFVVVAAAVYALYTKTIEIWVVNLVETIWI